MKTISVVNMKGGVAKTTIAVNLADCLSRRESKKVLLIDIDPQFNATQCLMSTERYITEREKGITICSIFDRNVRTKCSTTDPTVTIKPIAYEDIVPINVRPALDLILGDLDLYRVEMSVGLGKEQQLKKYLTSVSTKYDYVIIDTPPTPSAYMASALIASDYYLVPVKPEPLSAVGIDLLRSVIQEKKENYDLGIKCCGLLFTVVESTTVNYRDTKNYIESDNYWKDYILKPILPKATAIARMQGMQRTILEEGKDQLKYAINAITKEVIRRTI